MNTVGKVSIIKTKNQSVVGRKTVPNRAGFPPTNNYTKINEYNNHRNVTFSAIGALDFTGVLVAVFVFWIFISSKSKMQGKSVTFFEKNQKSPLFLSFSLS